MADLVMLGGGGLRDPADPWPGSNGAAEQSAMAEELFHLAESLRPRERRFCEEFMSSASEREALYAAWPQMRNEPENVQFSKLRSLRRTKRVTEFLRLSMGYGALDSAHSYTDTLDRIQFMIDDPSTPPHVKEKLLTTLVGQLHKNGVATREGFKGGDKSANEQRESGAVPPEEQDAFLVALGTHHQLPESSTG